MAVSGPVHSSTNHGFALLLYQTYKVKPLTTTVKRNWLYVLTYIMGNRIQGFLAGVALTAGTVLATSGRIQASLITASNIIRDTDYIINNRILTDRDTQLAHLPVNKRVSTTLRPSFWETSKDIWNEEIITMVNWLYSINWYQWGLDADRKFNKLTDKVVRLAVDKKE